MIEELMRNPFMKGDKLLLATHNKNKIEEFKFHLGDYFDLVTAKDLHIPEPEEIGTSFREISHLKARHAATISGLPSLADDSGICVKSLNNDPGIYSARWGGDERNPTVAMERVLKELALLGPGADRSATVVCSLTLYYPVVSDKINAYHYAEGEIKGSINHQIITTGRGYGYDPVFILDGHKETFNCFPDHVRWYHSHRGVACRKLIEMTVERRLMFIDN